MSAIVTVNEQLAVLPAASVAVQDSVVVPTGKTPLEPSPEARLVVAPHASEAVTEYATVLLHWLALAICVILLGQEMLGSTLSFVIVTSSEEVPQAPLVIVQRNVTEFEVNVNASVGFEVFRPVYVPLTVDHEPVPNEGVLAASVAVFPQIL